MTPCRGETELKGVLRELAPGHDFDKSTVHECYLNLASLIGAWQSERLRLSAELIRKTLLKAAKDLCDTSRMLSGLEPGIRSDIETAISSRVLNLLALDPSLGSKASPSQWLRSFRLDAERIAHVCTIAAVELPRHPDDRGRRPLDWYDSFTVMLLDIAEKADVRPTLYARGSGGRPRGWLLDAAGQLETFLPKEMRSPSEEARYKRLRRSKN